MKRTNNKSGSILNTNTTNQTPQYQQYSPLLGINKQLSQLSLNGQETNEFLQQQQDQRRIKTAKLLGTNSQANSIPSSCLSINKSEISVISPSIPSYQPSPLLSSYSSNALLGSGSKHTDSLNLNQKLLSNQKSGLLNPSTIPSPISVQQLLNYSQNINPNTHSSVSKSPVTTVLRSQNQNTPTSQKTPSVQQLNPSSIGGISPKNILTSGQKSQQASFHSHRPSLSSSGKQSNSNNENVNLKRQESKLDFQKNYYSTSSASEGQPSSILKENNNIRNIQNSAANIPSDSQHKLINLKSNRNHSQNTESSLNAVTQQTTNGSLSGNLLKNSSGILPSPLTYYSSQLSTDKRGSVQGKQHSNYILNGTNPTQNTETELRESSVEQNILINTSGLSTISNNEISQTNLSERSGFEQQSEILPSSQNSEVASLFSQKCKNHPEKKAKYIIYNYQSHTNFYCSKCAIEFSKFGYQTINIADFAKQQVSTQGQDLIQNQNTQQTITTPLNKEYQTQEETETQIKLKEINDFLSTIYTQGGKWQELNHALLIKKKDVSNFFERQQSRIESQFNGYIDLITQIKDNTLQKLNSNKEKTVSVYQLWEKETKESLTYFINTKADIEMNTDKIVNFIKMDDFSRIMGSYKEKLLNMTQFFSQMSNECLDLVKFDNSSPSPLSFSPQIEQSFSLLNFSTTLVKKRVSEFVANKKQSSQQQQQQNNSFQMQNLYFSNSSQSNSPNVNQRNSSRVHLESTRGSLAGNELQSHNFIKPQSPLLYPQSGQTVSDEQSYNVGSNLQSTCNSPVKVDQNMKYDASKELIVISFGGTQDLLKAAIQQGKNTQTAQQSQMTQGDSYHYSYQHSSVQEDSLQGTPLHNNGGYVNQIKPLTDIIEQTNVNEEDDRSQPNTPELKQIDDIPSRVCTPSSVANNNGLSADQQKPFRTLFGEEETKAISQGGQSTNGNNSLQGYQSPENVQYGKGNNLIGSVVKNSNSLKFGSSGGTKSPRYSMYECDDQCQESENKYNNNLNNKNNNSNNQLNEYLQMIENQKGSPISNSNSMISSNAFNQKGYSSFTQPQQVTANTKQSLQFQSNNSSNIVDNNNNTQNSYTSHYPINNYVQQNNYLIENHSLIQPKEDDHSILTKDKQEDMDNPLFSSPGYKP